MAMNAPVGVTADTLAAIQAALSAPGAVTASDAVLAKATTQGFSTATGLTGYLLEPGAKLLYPRLSPLRNRFPRHGAPIGATAVNWKAITAINASHLKAGVAEGVRNGVVSTTEVDRVQTFKDFGLDDSVTFRAIDAGRGFEDVRALSTANLLSAVMVEEEKIILGGNVTALGAPGALVFSDTATADAGALTASTAYYFAVSALTSYGYLNGAAGHGAADATDETTAVTGNHTTTASGAGNKTVTLSWPAKRGAVAYNVYAGTSATVYYVATVTSPRWTQSALCPTSGNVPNTADLTADPLSFDGLIPQIEVAGSGAYYKDLAGALLTTDSAGGIPEIDAMLQSLYDVSRISPSAILVNSQQAGDGGKRVASGSSTSQVQLFQQVGADGNISGGLTWAIYRNKFAGGQPIPVITHPYMAPGKLVAISESLPYPNNNVPNPFEIETLREYTQYDWALVQRKYEFGVYATEALKVYFPAGCGVITGIGAG